MPATGMIEWYRYMLDCVACFPKARLISPTPTVIVTVAVAVAVINTTNALNKLTKLLAVAIISVSLSAFGVTKGPSITLSTNQHSSKTTLKNQSCLEKTSNKSKKTNSVYLFVILLNKP
jgi:hypothetical protein